MFKLEDVRKWILEEKTEVRAVWTISLVVIGFGLYIAFLLYAAHRSLWVDEAMLAYSFSKRSIWNLTETIFEWNQSAPIVYLYIVKIITLIFGNTETALRIFSFGAYIGTLAMVYVVLDKLFLVKYPILGTAFVSTMKVLLYYSNEFKPYMNDCFCCLLVVYLYYLHRQKKLHFVVFVLACMVFPWMSYPTLFMIGGIYLYEWLLGIRNGNKRTVLKWTVGGLAILISFAVNYFYWLKPIADQEYMIDFWIDNKFPIFPTSFEDIGRLVSLSGSLISSMKYGAILVAGMTIVGVFIMAGGGNRYAIVMVMGVFLSLVASFLGKYPFHYRLMLFVFPIMAIFIFSALDALMIKNRGLKEKIVVYGIIFAIFISNYGSVLYLNPDKRIRSKEEANGIIEYLNENIADGEILYSYRSAVPVLSYKNGYDNFHIGKNVDQSVNNIIMGEEFFQDGVNDYEIERILALEKCYILMVHYNNRRAGPMVDALKENGYLEIAENMYNTLLYYHTNDLGNIKMDIDIELLDFFYSDGLAKAEIKVTNTGETWFNAEGIDDIHVSCREVPKLFFKVEKNNLQPNESFVQRIEFAWPEEYDVLNIQLINKGKYWFDQIGIKPTAIKRFNYK